MLGVGDLRVVQRAPHLAAVRREDGVEDQRRSARVCALRLRCRRKRSSVASAGCLQHLVAELLPLALVLQAQHHRLAVAGRERAIGVDGGVRGAGARRRRRAVERVVQRVAHPLGQRLEHRHVDVAALPVLPRCSSAARMLV
jgi:hypothetical protein